MQVNRFDVAAEAPIMNTYVPINFGELYRIGAHQAAEVEKASSQLGEALAKFGEFRSPSKVDTDNWYNLTTNRRDIQELLTRMTTDPDALKDAAFRAAITGAINSTDYAALSRLQQSREGMLARQKANQELMARGGYNPLLHDVNFSAYDTIGSGEIFNDISPLAYMSVVDMVKPYVDNMKGKFLGSRNGFLMQGVTDEMTDAQLAANMSSIENSPHYAQNLKLIQMQTGVDANTARDILNRKIFTAGREFTWNDAQRDPLVIAGARGGSGGQSAGMLSNLTDQIQSLAGQTYSRFVDDSIQRGKNGYAESLNEIFKNSAKANKSIRRAYEDVINQISTPIGQEASTVYNTMFTRKGMQTDKGWRLGNTSSDFQLVKRLVDNSRATGSNARPNKLQDDFEKGYFKDFFVAGDDKITTDGVNIYHNKYVYIPSDQIDGKYSADDITRTLGDWTNLGKDNVKITTVDDTTGTVRISTSKSLNSGRYLKIPVLTKIPTSGQPAIEYDAQYAQTRGVGEKLRGNMQMLSEYKRLLSTEDINEELEEEE